MKAICFVDNTHCVVSAGDNGSIHLWMVNYSVDSVAPKYGKIKVIAKHDLEQGEYAIWMESYRQGCFTSPLSHVRSQIAVGNSHQSLTYHIIRSQGHASPLYPRKSPPPWNANLLLHRQIPTYLASPRDLKRHPQPLGPAFSPSHQSMGTTTLQQHQAATGASNTWAWEMGVCRRRNKSWRNHCMGYR